MKQRSQNQILFCSESTSGTKFDILTEETATLLLHPDIARFRHGLDEVKGEG